MNIRDVADKTGVSVATVSRVLNGSANVRNETKERVLEAIREMRYTPNSLGRNLRTERTKTILVCVQSLANPFYAEIIKGIEHGAVRDDYCVFVCESYSSAKRYKRFVEDIKSKRADGIIVISPDSKESVQYFANVPTVVCCEADQTLDCDFVTIDDRQAGYAAVNRLITSGKTRIVCLGNQKVSGTLRFAGYKAALENSGIARQPALEFDSVYQYQEAYDCIKELLESGEPFDGVFALSDILATAAVNCLVAHGKRVPQDVGVIGFDNLIFAQMCSVPLTTIRQPCYEMGLQAYKMLIEKLESGEDPAHRQQIFMPHNLIVRSSV